MEGTSGFLVSIVACLDVWMPKCAAGLKLGLIWLSVAQSAGQLASEAGLRFALPSREEAQGFRSQRKLKTCSTVCSVFRRRLVPLCEFVKETHSWESWAFLEVPVSEGEAPRRLRLAAKSGFRNKGAILVPQKGGLRSALQAPFVWFTRERPPS